MKVTFYGIGYVGLVQAAVLADAGHQVCCVDSDETKIEALKNGDITIFEPGLTELVKKNYDENRLIFTSDAEYGVNFAEIQFIAVGTPTDEDGSADLKYVLKVAKTIATHMQLPKVIINKSTVPVGTADYVSIQVQDILTKRQTDTDFWVVSNPEFLKEGAAVEDCKNPDRIIIGTNSEYPQQILRELYEPFNPNNNKIIIMDVRSAELTKYAANCMLATKISFINEMSNIAELAGADIDNIRRGIGSDSRIGYNFINPGCGYGGSCFPKDIQALVRSSAILGYDSKILQAVESVNYEQKNKLYEYVTKHFGKDLHGKVFALWGLAFKPNTDDMRNAPSRVLMEALWEAGATVQAYDREAMEEAQRIYGNRKDLKLMDTKEAALHDADALVICTEWQSFKNPDFDLIKQELNNAVVFDGRNIYDPKKMKAKKIDYYSIGRLLNC